ncbi:MAG: hypothetical protein M0Z67_02630 [Nitrospiraceae bacterium]|nr:hypothetical protein [Nitrospiraceae bacterium]
MKTGDIINEGPFAGFEVIDTYSRAEAIADGVLVDVTDTAREAGILFPVAVTRSVLEEYIEPSSHDSEKWGQDLMGRLWDTVWMLRIAIRGRKQSEDRRRTPASSISKSTTACRDTFAGYLSRPCAVRVTTVLPLSP